MWPVLAAAWPAPVLDLGGAATRSEYFPAAPELEPAVRFWADLFTKHDSDRVVLHDREHMEIVWEVMQLPRDEKGEVLEEKARELVKKTTDALRSRLRRLERNPTPRDEEDHVIIALAGDRDPTRIEGAWRRVRAQRGVADKLRAGIERAKIYQEEILSILAEEGVPAEIGALPFVESMYNPEARSSAGAAGLWQLMPATARGLGLVVNKTRDDRFDVEMSTHAAARMLQQNYRMLGSWPLAITGYNHGPYGVKRAVKAVGSTDLVYLIEHYKKDSWGFASKNFYAEFLAVADIFVDLEKKRDAVVQKEAPSTAEGQLR